MAAETTYTLLAANPFAWWSDLDAWSKTAVAVVGMLLASILVKKLLLGRLERLAERTDNDLDDRLVQFFRSFFFLGMFFLTIVWILRIHGKEISAILAGAGIAGIAVGLAAKETLSDVLSGIFLISDRPFRVGDRVKIERIGRHWGDWGDVIDLGIRRTQVRNTDGIVVNYPNTVLANSVITNFTKDSQPVRVRVRFQLDYSADLARAREVAIAAMSRSEGVIPDTAEVVYRSLWDDDRGHLLAGVLVEGRYRIADVRRRTKVRSGVLENILVDLRAAGIPFPAPEIQIRSPKV